MEDCGNRWSWEENKLFEVALAEVDDKDPQRWEVVAAMVGGHRTAADVRNHYEILLQDLHLIESGVLDHKLLQHLISAPFQSIIGTGNLKSCSLCGCQDNPTPC